MPTAAIKTTSKKASAASAHEAPSYTPPLYDPASGEKALAALLPEILAVAEPELLAINVDVEAATYAALGVVGFVSSADVRARFARLPEKEFDIADLDGLGPACFATLHAIAEARSAGALENDVRLPSALVAEAVEVERRMQTLCEYHLADDPELKPEIERLRPGSGHRDLANDLLGYARLYALRPDVVKADRKNYRTEDAARAKELAGMMIQRLSAAMTPKARATYDRYVRVWTLLNRRYNEVRAAGLWLFRNDSRASSRFLSLFTAARSSGGGRTKKVEPKGVTAPDSGGADGDTPGDGPVTTPA